MGNVEQGIRQKLQSALQIHLLEVINESPHHQGPADAETHFRILIVSKDFRELGNIQRQQMVYRILEEEMQGPVHALSQKTFTPEEWDQVSHPPSATPPCHKKIKRKHEY